MTKKKTNRHRKFTLEQEETMFKDWMNKESVAKIAKKNEVVPNTINFIKKRNKWDERKKKIMNRVFEENEDKIVKAEKGMVEYVCEAVNIYSKKLFNYKRLMNENTTLDSDTDLVKNTGDMKKLLEMIYLIKNNGVEKKLLDINEYTKVNMSSETRIKIMKMILEEREKNKIIDVESEDIKKIKGPKIE